MTCVREVISSNFGRIPATLREGFLSFLYPSQLNGGIGYDHFLPYHFQFIIHELSLAFGAIFYEIVISP
jgi:hypothetical protein